MTDRDPFKQDFRLFLCLIWRHLKLPDPTPLQCDMAWYLQHGPNRAMIQAFRGAAKSWITAAYCLWVLYCNPQLNVVIVSASKQRADAFTQFLLRLIDEIPALQHLKPRDGQRRSMICFDVGPARASQTASVTSVGIYGQATGMRADVLIADDIEVPNNSETVLQREKLSERIKEFDALIKPGGRIVYLGTPQTEDSIYRVLPERGYDVRVWPIRHPSKREQETYAGRLAPWIADAPENLWGRSTEPTRFTDADIAARELSYGRAGFALQFMLDTRLSDGDTFPLKLSDLLVYALDNEMGPERLIWSGGPERLASDLPNVGLRGDRWYNAIALTADSKEVRYTKYTGVVMAIDPGGKGKDETGYAVVAMLNGQLFVLDAGGLKGYGEDTMEEIARIAKVYKVQRIIVEENFGGGMFAQLLKPVVNRVYPCGVEEVRSSKQKELRIIDTLEPVMTAHRLVVNRGLIQKDYDSVAGRDIETAQLYRLFYQLTRVSRLKGCLVHDDRLDALSMAVAHWVNVMAIDVDKAVKASREQEVDRALKAFVDGVKGRKSRGTGRVWARSGH